MIITQIKPSLAGGEFSPSLYPRVDLAKYTSGAKTLKNMFVHPHGGASNRPGLYMVAPRKFPTKKVKTVPFEFSTVQAYTIEFGEYYCRFYMNHGQILKYTTWVTATAYAVGDYVKNGTTYYRCKTAHTASAAFATDSAKWEDTSWVTGTSYVRGDWVTNSGVMYYCDIAHTASAAFATDLAAVKWVAQVIYEIPTPYSESDLPLLEYTQSADVLFVTHPTLQTREITRLGHSNWTIGLYNFIGGPFRLPNTATGKTIAASAVTGSVTLTASGFTFQPTHVGSLWELSHYIQSQSLVNAFTGTGQSTTIQCGGTWRIITHGTWNGKIVVEKSTDGGTVWTAIRSFSSASDFNVDTYGSEDMSENASPFLIRVNCTTYASGTINVDLSSDAFNQSGIARITAVAGGGVTATATVERTIGATSETIDWAEGAWSDYRGWPATVEFHPEDRLAFANTTTDPQTIWMTKTGNYYDFSRSSPLVDSDGITINLPSRKVNGVYSLVPLTALLALTSSCEASVSSSSGALAPTTVQTKINGYEGAAQTKPVVIGNRAIYVQNMGGVVRDLGYELQSDSFTGTDISILANHLFDGHEIIEIAYQQNPNRIVWALRDDGILLALTYMREQEVVAWTWHETDGTIESICVIPSDGYNELWLSVDRDGVGYIERMAQRMPTTDIEDQFFVDCGLTYDGAPASVITGLSHLEGRTVAILADGNVMPQMVVSGGQVTIPVTASKVHVGLPYTSDVETLNVEVQFANGTLQGKKVKINDVVFMFLNSAGGWIGPDFDTLHEIEELARDTYDDALPLFSGESKQNLGAGYTSGGRICFRQIDPLPVTILAFIPSITPGG